MLHRNASMLLEKHCWILRGFGHVWLFFTWFQDLTGTTGSQTWQSSFPHWVAFRGGFDSSSEGRRRKITVNQNVIQCRCDKIPCFIQDVWGWQALLHPAQSAGGLTGQGHLQRPDVNSWEQPLNLFFSLSPCIPVEYCFLACLGSFLALGARGLFQLLGSSEPGSSGHPFAGPGLKVIASWIGALFWNLLLFMDF